MDLDAAFDKLLEEANNDEEERQRSAKKEKKKKVSCALLCWDAADALPGEAPQEAPGAARARHTQALTVARSQT